MVDAWLGIARSYVGAKSLPIKLFTDFQFSENFN